VRIEARRPVEPCWALADPGALAQIVRILLDNALGVTPEETSVRMHASIDSRHAQLLVSDEGPGVPSDERERIFGRFQRGSTTGGRSGFGLGLAIGSELAARMGGTLELLDPQCDGGAHFALRLPRARMEEDA
jgi:signal transduction histidine kinase